MKSHKNSKSFKLWNKTAGIKTPGNALLLFFAFCLTFTSCKRPAYTLQKKYGNDIHYFLGLKNLENGTIPEAQKNFSLCVKKGSSWCARRSNENLILLQNQKNRIEMEDLYLEKYKDEDALLFAVKDYYSSREYSRVIFFTNDLDFSAASSALIALRLRSMKEKNDSRLLDEMFKWFMECSLSTEHQNFYNDYSNYMEESLSEAQKTLLNFRMKAKKRQYSEIVDEVPEIFQIFRESVVAQNPVENMAALNNTGTGSFAVPLAFIPSQFCSDIGKTLVYGNKNYLQNARILENYLAFLNEKNKAEEAHQSPYGAVFTPASGSSGEEDFYFNFYAGRLYDLAGEYFSKAENAYKKAMECTSDGTKKDNALWYILKLKIRRNTSAGCAAVQEYAKSWNDASYFDDLLDLLSNLLLTEGKWNEFYKIYKSINGYASDYMVSRYAYISARLLQEKMADESVYSKEDTSQALFYQALSSGGDYYYMVSAISRLEISEKEIEKFLCKTRLLDSEKNEKIDRDAEILLRGYADFGFADKIYPEFVKLTSTGSILSMDCITTLSSFLNECGKNYPKYYPQALRMAAKAVKKSDRNITKEELKLLFPKDYRSLIDEAAQKYEIPEALLYGLIRSESFFDKDVKSFASAVGLTQLMDSTAGDVARKLKIKEFDLRDAETNIEFGAFYLAELLRRLNSSQIQALLSYNTGITRIRRWVAQKKSLPMDLFLEIAPYDETREYGRKLTGASSMYAWLYDDKPIKETVEEILR